MIDLSHVPGSPTRPVWCSVLRSVLSTTRLLGGAWGFTRWNPLADVRRQSTCLSPDRYGRGWGRPVHLNTFGGQTATVLFSLLQRSHGCPTMLTASEGVRLALPADQRRVVWDEAQLTDVERGVRAVTL